MTLHLGKVKPGSTVYIPFDTFAGSTGASITMSGLATSDILVYRNGSTTQRGSTTGFTLLDTDGIDFDAVTGIHGLSIDLSSNATADFYTAGAMYWVVISTITVDSQTVSFVLATFTIGYEGAILDTTIATLSSQTSFTLTAGPAEDDALNGCEVIIHDIASAVQLGRAWVSDYTGSTRTVTLAAGTTFTAAAGDNISIFRSALQPTVQGRTLDVSTGGEAGIDWANIGSPTTAQNLSATNIDVDQVVASVSGAVGSVTGAVGSVTGNVGGNVTGSVGSIATGGIAAASFAAGAIDNAAIATDAIGSAELAASAITEIQSGLSTLDAAGVRAAVGLASANLDTQLADLPTAAENADAVWDEDATGHQTQGTFGQAIGDPAADTDTIWGLVNTNLNATVSSRASQTTADAIEADTQDIQTRLPAALVSGRIDASVGAMAADTITSSALAASASGEIADAVWDETLAGHLGAGSTGEALNAAGAAGDPWTTALPGAYGAGSAGNIIGNSLDVAISTRATPAQVNTEADTALSDVGLTTTITGRIDAAISTRLASASYTAPDNSTISTINSKVGTPSDLGGGASLAANLADIEAQTDDIGSAGAGLTALASAANLATLAGYVDTEVAAIKAKTDNLPTDPADQSAVEAAITAATTGLATASALSTVSGLVDDLETRLTAARAGYLDNLSGGAVALQSSVDSLEAGVVLTNAGIDAIFDRTDGVETGYTLRQALRLMAAALAGELSGAATTTITIRNITDTKARITATVDADGNRTALTLDAT